MLGDKNFVVSNELGQNCQISLPVLDPVLRITPIPFGLVGYLSQSGGFFPRCFSNFQAVSPVLATYLVFFLQLTCLAFR